MKLVETADGQVRVYELDPEKHYVLFIDPDCLYGEISLLHGAINMIRHPSESVVIVESPEAIESTVMAEVWTCPRCFTVSHVDRSPAGSNPHVCHA